MAVSHIGATGMRAGGCRRPRLASLSGLAQVGSGHLALLAALDVVLDLVAFLRRTNAGALNVGDVKEHVLRVKRGAKVRCFR